MTDEQGDAINRLRSWIENYGHAMQPEFIRDLETVLDMASLDSSKITGTSYEITDQRDFAYIANAHNTLSQVSSVNANLAICTCHERDGSYVCDYCKAQGERGHMQGVMQ